MIRAEVTDGRGRRLRSQALGRWLERHAPSAAAGDVVIALISDPAMRRINRTFRGADYATDVLSFPADTPARRGRAPRHLGELAIATGVLRRQARAAGHSEAVEARILALHGLLHLMGYDHETDNGRMRRAEERLRKRAGLPAGLIARQT